MPSEKEAAIGAITAAEAVVVVAAAAVAEINAVAVAVDHARVAAVADGETLEIAARQSRAPLKPVDLLLASLLTPQLGHSTGDIPVLDDDVSVAIPAETMWRGEETVVELLHRNRLLGPQLLVRLVP